MFKKSRRKIVAAIMSIMVLLWVSTMGMIYASSYFDMKQQNKQMLSAYAQMYTLSQTMEGTTLPGMLFPGNNPGFGPGFSDTPMFQLSTFYSVALSYNGTILEIRNEPSTLYTDEQLIRMTQDIILGGKYSGAKNNLAFLVMDKGGYLLVAFMDNTVVNESAMTLLRYTLIFGGALLVLFFFLSRQLAQKIVDPLEESYQKQKQFISDAGHELKTPISVVSANAELLTRELGDNQWLQNIQYENQRMGLLVSQLLELARTENVAPQLEYVDMSRLVSGEALPFESVAFEKGLTLNSDIQSNLAVEGSKAQLKQLTAILLDNAIAHSKGQGEVSLTLRQEPGSVILSVINAGDEIPAPQRERIFERFYRVDTARTGEDKHYGLGLAIAKGIMTAHHGSIEVRCYHGLVEFRACLPRVKEK